jgi:hypothetical protein
MLALPQNMKDRSTAVVDDSAINRGAVVVLETKVIRCCHWLKSLGLGFLIDPTYKPRPTTRILA